MIIITSHKNLDFDGLASMVAAKKLYPSGLLIDPGGLTQNVQDFMALYKDVFSLARMENLEVSRIKKAVLVDINSFHRLDEAIVPALSGLEIEVFDHHPSSDLFPSGTLVHSEPIGATVTLLLEKLISMEIAINPVEATLFALGIYQDTGNLRYQSTTPRDAAAVSFLLGKGAGLEVVNSFLEPPLGDKQQSLLNCFLDTAFKKDYAGTQIWFASATMERFFNGIGLVAEKFLEIVNGEVVFGIVQAAKKTFVIGRSKSDHIKVNRVLACIGGNGHPGAASASIKNSSIADVAAFLFAEIAKQCQPLTIVRDIMSSPVKTIFPEMNIAEAQGILLRYGHSGLPVMKEEKLLGIVSRRDLEKGLRHGLGHAPVKAYMTNQVVTIKPEATIREAQTLMIKHDIGRIPVIENGKLIGIISRSDVLKKIHEGAVLQEPYPLLLNKNVEITPEKAKMIMQNSSPKLWDSISILGRLADELGINAYLVGGTVRDLLLNIPSLDVDIVVEGDGIDFAHKLTRLLDAEIVEHERFGTVTLLLPSEVKIDIASARKEYYEYPAALPKVETADLKEDLYRRDFTINAMAIRLNLKEWGGFIDFFGGYSDITNKIIRVLHNFSFIEDPTRVLRAVRFENRYGFQMELATKRLAMDQQVLLAIAKLSGARIWSELSALLVQTKPDQSFDRLLELGVLEAIFPSLGYDQDLRSLLIQLEKILEAYPEVIDQIDRPIVFVGCLVHSWSREQVISIGKRFNLSKQAFHKLKKINQINITLSIPQLNMISLHKVFQGYPDEAVVLWIAAQKELKDAQMVIKYVIQRKKTVSFITGKELIELGIAPGPRLKEVLKVLEGAYLDGLVTNREDALSFSRSLFNAGRG